MSDLALFTKPSRRRSTARGTALRVEVGKRTCWLYGAGIKPIIMAVGAPSQWDSARRCWMVSVNRIDDVMAWAEHRERRFLTVEAVAR